MIAVYVLCIFIRALVLDTTTPTTTPAIIIAPVNIISDSFFPFFFYFSRQRIEEELSILFLIRSLFIRIVRSSFMQKNHWPS